MPFLRSNLARAATCFLLVIPATGCQSDSSAICDKADECGLLTESVDECVDRLDDLVEDKTLSEDGASDCASCYDDNSCGELRGGDCAAVCIGALFD